MGFRGPPSFSVALRDSAGVFCAPSSNMLYLAWFGNCIELFALFAGELDVEGTKDVVDVFGLVWAEDGDDVVVVEEPGNGDLCWGGVVFGGDVDNGLYGVVGAFGHVGFESVFAIGPEAAFGQSLAAAKLASEQANGEGAVGHDAQSEAVGYGHEVGFHIVAFKQIVRVLDAGIGHVVVAVGNPEALYNEGARVVAAANVANFSLLYEVVHRAKGFFEVGGGVDVVD